MMRKPLLLTALFATLLWGTSTAQSTANYTVTSSATGSLYTMIGSVPLIASGQDDKASELFPIGFDFWFMGTRYDQFSASSNGAIRLGGTAISSTMYGSGFPVSGAIIAPFLQNIETSATGKVHFMNTGTYPNRKLVVEFLNMGMNKGSTSADGTFQLVLSESTGVIQYIYGAMAEASAATPANNQKAVIGFCSSTTANTLLTVPHATPFTANTTTTITSVNYTSTGNIAGLNSAANGSRVQITFTPPVRTAPTSVTFTSTSATGTTVNWVDGVPNELGFVVYISDDGGLSYTFDNQTAANGTSDIVTPLLPGKTYNFKVFSVSEGALSATGPTGSVTCSACALSGTNTCTYTGGSTNWSSLTWSLGHVPTQCEDAVLTVNRTSGSSGENIDITLDVDVACKSITINNISSSTSLKKYVRILGSGKVYLSGDLTLTGAGGNKYNRCVFAPTVSTVIDGNVIMGNASPIATEGYTSIGSSSLTIPNENYLLRGNLTFNKRSYITDEHAIFTFDKNGTQYIYNNIPTGTADTLQAVLFENLILGNAYAPTLIFAGTGGQDGYIESQSRGGVVMNPGTTMVLPNTYSLNCLGGSAYFKMGANTKLQLGGDQSVIDPYTMTAFGVAGSNFPASFTNYILDPTSLIEYNGPNSITQTIYHGITYQKLEVTNGTGSGRAPKNTTGALNVAISAKINALTDVTLGNTVSCAGPLDVVATAGLYCATNVVSGAGAFTLASTGYLGMGHLSGITSGTTANGNIQMMGGRSFNQGANYIYNGSGTQVTGNGLPVICNDLTIDNPVTVTIGNDQVVNGVNTLKQGIFDIGTTKLTINGAGTLTSTGGKMKANAGVLNMAGTSGTAQSLAGSWFLNRNISTLVNSNTKGITVAATAGDTLVISSGLLYGASTTNSTITTNDNITLLSRDTATARFGEIVTGSSNAITGKVNVERYISTLRKWRHLAWPTTSTQTAKQAWMENNSANGNTVAGYGCIVTDEKATWSGFGFDSQSLSGPSVKYWNPTTGAYVGIPNTTSYQMNTQSAYFNFVRGDRSCTPANSLTSSTILRTTGTLKTGNQVFTIPAGKYGAVGNPFASAIDLRKVDTLNLTSTFYVWDPKLTGYYGLGAYQTIYVSGANYVVLPGGGSYGTLNTPVDTLESGQAMYVKARTSAGTVTFKENAKTIGKRTMARTSVGEEAVYSLLSLRDPGGNTLVDGCMAAFDYTYHNAVDDGDATKMTNTSENVSLRREGQLLAIERRGAVMQDDTLFLNITGLRIHAYQWDITMDEMLAPNRTAWLVDNYLGTQTQLNLVTPNAVQFDVVGASASYAADRFMIIFRQQQGTLPVRFTNISAIRNQNKTVTVLWNTATEMFMDSYKVERSPDGINFTEIATVAPTANNGGGASYTYLDKYASEAVNYYRVNGISHNGQSQRTATVKVGPLTKETTISIYPNPVTDGIVNLRFENQPKGDYSVRITNKLGQLIRTENVSVQNSNTVQMIHLGNIASGSYQATVTDESGTGSTISFVVR